MSDIHIYFLSQNDGMKTDIVSRREKKDVSRVLLTAAQMEQQIQNRVIVLTRLHSDIITQDNEIIPPLQEEETRKYIQEVLVELGRIERRD